MNYREYFRANNIERKGEKMGKITLFHGTPDKIVVPTYGKGEKRHDYGMGF